MWKRPTLVGQLTAGQDDTSELFAIQPQKNDFTWRDMAYDIEINGESRRLLDHVSGCVKPGTLTALMGVSGAGTTTLLYVQAHRTSVGVVTGDMFVNGNSLKSGARRDMYSSKFTPAHSLKWLSPPFQIPKLPEQELSSCFLCCSYSVVLCSPPAPYQGFGYLRIASHLSPTGLALRFPRKCTVASLSAVPLSFPFRPAVRSDVWSIPWQVRWACRWSTT